MPTLDILIPHYNDVAGLELSLASVDSQTWSGDWRVVIADDGSDPAAAEALLRIAEKRPDQIIIIRNSTNRGRPFARNMLLDAVESPYIAWLDAGDEWYPNKLSAQFETVVGLEENSHPSPYWVTCDFDFHWVGGPLLPTKQRVDQDQMKALLGDYSLRAYLWSLVGPSHTFKDVGRFDEQLPRLSDLDFFIRFLQKGGRLHAPSENQPLCVYYKTEIGLSADQIHACYSHIFDKHPDVYNQYGTRFRGDCLFRMDVHAARSATINNDKGRREYYSARAFRRRPLRMAGLTLGYLLGRSSR